MNTTITHQEWGDVFTLTPGFGYYDTGRVAIRMFDEHGEPFATITVNIPNEPLANDEVIVKDWNENEGIVTTLERAGWLVPSGRSVPSNRVTAPVMYLGGPLADAYEAWNEGAA